MYEKGLSTGEIAAINNRVAGNHQIVGDSAEPRLISELQREGNNIIGAEKGAGSITSGISKMLDYEIVITPDSLDLKRELTNYKWASKKSGVPIDKHNHIIDAIRYAFKFVNGGSGEYFWGS